MSTIALNIDQKLTDLYLALTPSRRDQDQPTLPSLFGGKSGELLFQLYYLKSVNKSDALLEQELVNFLSHYLEKGFESSTFSHGLTGFAWFISHIQSNGFIELDEDLLTAFDQNIFRSALNDLKHNNHDYMHGAFGKLFYLAERNKKTEEHKRYINKLISELKKLSTSDNQGGCYWLEPLEKLTQDETDKKVIYLHISHGLSGKISVLNKLAADYPLAQHLLEECLHFLLHSKVKCTDGYEYPYRILNDKKDTKTHMGWCRSNLAIGLAIGNSGLVLNRSELLQEAERVGLHCLDRIEKEKIDLVDPGLCHGKAGLGLLFLHFYNLTKNERFLAASHLWCEKTFAAASFENGVEGFCTYDGVNKNWKKDYSLLTGISGIGLFLLSINQESSLPWDNFLLLNQ